jgi:hypothetical protein
VRAIGSATAPPTISGPVQAEEAQEAAVDRDARIVDAHPPCGHLVAAERVPGRTNLTAA